MTNFEIAKERNTNNGSTQLDLEALSRKKSKDSIMLYLSALGGKYTLIFKIL